MSSGFWLFASNILNDFGATSWRNFKAVGLVLSAEFLFAHMWAGVSFLPFLASSLPPNWCIISSHAPASGDEKLTTAYAHF